MAVTSFNHFPQIANNLHNGLKRTVKKVAKDMQKDASDFAPKDTGFMSKNIYTTGWWGSDYGKGVQQAGSLKANKQGVITRRRIQGYIKRTDRQKAQEALLFPEIPPPPDELTGYVVSAAMYSIFPNYGTRYQAAQPFWEPALNVAKVNLDGQLAVLAASLGASTSGSIEDISV